MGELFQEYVMGENVRRGVTLYQWKSDGKLHSNPDGTLQRMAAVGISASEINRGEYVRVGPGGVVRRFIANPCGRLHLGHVVITGRGFHCSTCHDQLDADERAAMTRSYKIVREILEHAAKGRNAK